ncbi:MAG: glycosyltransferase [Terrimicrobiaceae bacterium]|nr:glycosyltransferase [Terrimicrobiaceae bacterium]
MGAVRRVKVSIITPSLNSAAFLEECLRSVRAAGGDAEHIVVDGGSTDATLGILENTPGIRWISEPDGGQAEAINKGLAMAAGDILSYLCADDFLEPGSLDLVLEAFQAPVDVVYGDAWFLEGDSGWRRRKTAGAFSYRRLRRGNFLLQPAVFFHRRVYESHGGFDESLHYCMDHEYWLRIGASTRWHYLARPLATCRLHPGAKTFRALAPAWAEAARMQRRYGLWLRPQMQALWMRLGGQGYYRLKRRVFRAIGKRLRVRHRIPSSAVCSAGK